MSADARVVVVGGGLAGLAAAAALAARGVGVTVLESKSRLGGRAGSFTDAATGQTLDACQHVSMGCCTNLKHFLDAAGVGHHLEPQHTLYFQTPDGRTSRFKADPWPAPFHLGRALAAAHYLTPWDKVRIGAGMLALWVADDRADPPLLQWLERHYQTPRTITRFWGVVLTSALNETVDRVGLRYAKKVFVDGFLSHRDAFTVEVPRVPLGHLYGAEMQARLTARGVEVWLNAAAKRVELDAVGRAAQVRLRDGSVVPAAAVVLAAPAGRVADLLPPDVAAREPFAGAARLNSSPITSVHVWFDRPVLPVPHAVLVDGFGQWVFGRGETVPGEHYVQVVVSAARDLKPLGHAEIERRTVEELRRLYPRARDAVVRRARVVTEHAATFSAVPGVDADRGEAETDVPGLVLAGDWTRTGWPATMEGAVRSGYRAAEVVLAGMGRPARVVRAGLSGGVR